MAMIPVGDGSRLHVTDAGQGRPAVLIAGFGLDHRLWDRQVRELACAGHRVLCVDQRGHGWSDKPLNGYGIGQLRSDLVEVLDHFELDEVALVGHSFGGLVAFAAAAATARVERLVIVGSNGVAASRSDSFPFGAPAESILPALLAAEVDDRISSRRRQIVSSFARPPAEEVIDWLMSQSLHMPSWAASACFETLMTTELANAIDQVTLPVLQINGSADPVTSARGAHWLAERLANSRLVELAGCGHYPMLEAPTEFGHELGAFLNR